MRPSARFQTQKKTDTQQKLYCNHLNYHRKSTSSASRRANETRNGEKSTIISLSWSWSIYKTAEFEKRVCVLIKDNAGRLSGFKWNIRLIYYSYQNDGVDYNKKSCEKSGMRDQLTFRGTNEAIPRKRRKKLVFCLRELCHRWSVNFRCCCCYSRGESGRKKIVESRKRVLKLFKNYADTRIVH